MKLKDLLVLFNSKNEILYEVLAINALAILCSLQCISFSTETDITYDKYLIDKYSKLSQDTYCEKILTYHY